MLMPALDRIFATHGIPESLTTDNGPPYFGDELEAYAKRLGFKLTPVTPEDPQSNGFAENFVKSVCKVVHTAVAEKKDPKEELYTFLLQYRATPHSTTEMSPAEMLFGRKIKTKLPQMQLLEETPRQKETRQIHDKKKLEQKKAFDKRYHAKPKPISPGDQVLLKQKKSTIKPPFNPEPFTVEKVSGNQLTLSNKGITRVRDKNKVKVIPQRPAPFTTNNLHTTVREEMDFDIDMRKIRTPEGEQPLPQINNESHPGSAAEPQNMEGLEESEADHTVQQEDGTPASNIAGQHIFVATDDMNAHLLQLLNVAQGSNSPQDMGDTVEPTLHEPHDATPHEHTNQPTKFTPTNEMNAHLQRLLGAAQARDSSSPAQGKDESDEGEKNIRVTRSRGVTLAWNPVMNAGKAVLEKKE